MGFLSKRTKTKTRRYLRDMDQIQADLKSPRHLAQHKESKPAEDLPGLGRYYCVQCAKWFETDISLLTHRKGKPHKRNLKALREGPFTHEEAAVGLRTDNGPVRMSEKSQEIEMET
ncbi:zinc finger domain-containing protein [Lasiosphaeria ovina]|uniref:Zinc finger domain-containing protein n=1 Tax=Lasiosphaeria ovina TaxID=92902 RepID=A0AAE0NAF0_9PEZI|nr:zinc finger domain-containing protein [Lasiosphaeria ovina]